MRTEFNAVHVEPAVRTNSEIILHALGTHLSLVAQWERVITVLFLSPKSWLGEDWSCHDGVR